MYAHFRKTVCVVHPESIQHSEDLSLFGESPSIKQWLRLNSVFYCDYNFSLPWVKHTLCSTNHNDQHTTQEGIKLRLRSQSWWFFPWIWFYSQPKIDLDLCQIPISCCENPNLEPSIQIFTSEVDCRKQDNVQISEKLLNKQIRSITCLSMSDITGNLHLYCTFPVSSLHYITIKTFCHKLNS